MIELGGLVMCVCAKCSDTANPRFVFIVHQVRKIQKILKKKTHLSFKKHINEKKKQNRIRGPRRPASFESNGQLKHKMQILANNNYDKKSISMIKKNTYSKRKQNQIKTELNKLTLTSLDRYKNCQR